MLVWLNKILIKKLKGLVDFQNENVLIIYSASLLFSVHFFISFLSRKGWNDFPKTLHFFSAGERKKLYVRPPYCHYYDLPISVTSLHFHISSPLASWDSKVSIGSALENLSRSSSLFGYLLAVLYIWWILMYWCNVLIHKLFLSQTVKRPFIQSMITIPITVVYTPANNNNNQFF